MAQGALQASGLPIINGANDGDYLVIGGNAQVVVSIVCVPQPGGVCLVVNACAPDLATAELASNQIGNLIVNNV